MGLLDDAIRQHLELKRRHGASDEELSRQEAEALGPARREVAPAAELPEAPVAAQEDTALPGEPPSLDEPPAFEPGALGDAAPHGDPLREPPPAEEPVAADPDAAEPPSRPAPVDAAPEPPAEEEPVFEGEPPLVRGDTPPHGTPAVEGAAEEPDEEEPDEEDVLDETPDFLQDAPEHDRLWFEQKPPRDFDFD